MNSIEEIRRTLLISMRTEVTGIRTENATMKMQKLLYNRTDDETSANTQIMTLWSIQAHMMPWDK